MSHNGELPRAGNARVGETREATLDGELGGEIGRACSAACDGEARTARLAMEIGQARGVVSTRCELRRNWPDAEGRP